MNAYLNLKHFKTKKNALCLIAVTDLDLWNDDLEFVFGLACPMTCVGISSIHRQVSSFT